MDDIGYTRVTSGRWNSPCPPEEGEVVFWVDRSNPVLGNPYHMKEKSEAERTRVINQYRDRARADFKAKGPMYRVMLSLARRVVVGEKIALNCHCAPIACHGDVIKAGVDFLVREILEGRIGRKEE